MHKPDCKNKGPKTAVLMKEMKDSAKSWTAKYAEMVKEITNAPVSEAHQKGVFPGTVQFLKKYLLLHKEYDSRKGLEDLSCSAEFLDALHSFLEEQAGYESLVGMKSTVEEDN